MIKIMPDYELSNGVLMPYIGFGTYPIPNNEQGLSVILNAIEVGYRHIDTAQMYGNESIIGKAIKKSGIPRSEFFITSKVADKSHGNKKAKEAFEKTLELLDTDYLDLYLIHWPNPLMIKNHRRNTNLSTWSAFVELYQNNRVRAIGVSNFEHHHIKELQFDTTSISPMVNQISLSPGKLRRGITAFCKEEGIVLQAYSPFANGEILNNHDLQFVAKKYGKTVAQICIRWSIQQGYSPLPRSCSIDHMKENIDVFDFYIDDDDIDIISGNILNF